MNPIKDGDDRTKRRDTYENINNEILEKIFDEMKKIFESKDLKEIIEDMFCNNFSSNTRYILDYGMKTDLYNTPINHEFVNFQKRPKTENQVYSNDRELPIDVIEGDDSISITIEIPGVRKEDIKSIINEKTLEINVNTPNVNYHKLINLPCRVKEKTKKTTYKNGIFDIVIKIKKKRTKEEGHKVDIE